MQVALAGTATTPKWVLPWGEDNITTHPTILIVPAAKNYNWHYRECAFQSAHLQLRQASGLIAVSPHQQKPLGTRQEKHPVGQCNCSPSGQTRGRHLVSLWSPPTEASQGIIQGGHPAVQCNWNIRKQAESRHLVWLLTPSHYHFMMTPEWPFNNRETTPNLEKAKVHCIQLDWRQMWLCLKSRAHATHKGDIPEAPVPAKQQTLCRTTGSLLHKAASFHIRRHQLLS